MKKPQDSEDIIDFIAFGDPAAIISKFIRFYSMMFKVRLFSKLVGVIILNLVAYKYSNIQKWLLERSYKFVVGMCIAILTMLTAAVVEKVRRDNCDSGIVLVLKK